MENTKKPQLTVKSGNSVITRGSSSERGLNVKAHPRREIKKPERQVKLPGPVDNSSGSSPNQNDKVGEGQEQAIFVRSDNKDKMEEEPNKPKMTLKTNDKKSKAYKQPVEIKDDSNDNYFTKKCPVLSEQWYELVIKSKNSGNNIKLLIKILNESKVPLISPIKITNDLFVSEKYPNNIVDYKIYLYVPNDTNIIDTYFVGQKVYNVNLLPVDKNIVEQNIDLWKFRKLYDLDFINYYISNAEFEYSEKFIGRFKADYELYKCPNYFDEFITTLTISPSKNSITSDKINVLYLVHSSIEYEFYSYTVRTHQLLDNFNKYNNNYKIICATRYGYPYDREVGYYGKDVTKITKYGNVKYVKLINDKSSNFNTLNILEYIKQYIIETINFCIDNNIKIVHATTNYWNGIVAVCTAKYLGIKCIYELRELWNENIMLQRPEVLYSDVVKMMSVQEKNILNDVDKIIVLNDIQNKDNDKKVEVLYDGCTINIVDNKKVKDKLLDKHELKYKIIIGYIGTLSNDEGIEYILKCLKLLNNDNITFVVIGDGPYKGYMMDFIKLNSLEDNVLYLGKLAHEEAIQYYEIFDMCIYPKKKCDLHELKSSFKLVEALSYGKPVITTMLGASSEIIIDGTNGLISAVDDVNDLLDKIKMLISNNELRLTLGSGAKEWTSKNRNWITICNKLANIYDELLCDDSNDCTFEECTPVIDDYPTILSEEPSSKDDEDELYVQDQA